MFKEFKEFISQGSAMDAAIGFVMGLAFKAVIDSVVNSILMPIIGYITAGIDFKDLKIVLRQAADKAHPEIAITYGQLIQTLITFLLISIFLFFVVKSMNVARKKREEARIKKEGESKEEEAENEETELSILQDIKEILSKKSE